MSERITRGCPDCPDGEIEIEVTADHVHGEAHIVWQSCNCERDPSQREAIEREAIEAVTEGSQV